MTHVRSACPARSSVAMRGSARDSDEFAAMTMTRAAHSSTSSARSRPGIAVRVGVDVPSSSSSVDIGPRPRERAVRGARAAVRGAVHDERRTTAGPAHLVLARRRRDGHEGVLPGATLTSSVPAGGAAQPRRSVLATAVPTITLDDGTPSRSRGSASSRSSPTTPPRRCARPRGRVPPQRHGAGVTGPSAADRRPPLRRDSVSRWKVLGELHQGGPSPPGCRDPRSTDWSA